MPHPAARSRGQRTEELARAVLEMRDLRLSFGGVHALRSVDLAVPDRTVCGPVGPNGAGKTALLDCVSGIYRHSSGSCECPGTGGDATRTAAMIIDCHGHTTGSHYLDADTTAFVQALTSGFFRSSRGRG